MDVVRRPKDAFLMESEFSSTNLDRAGHFGPWQQPAEKRQAVDHFGSESLWIPRAGRLERRREEEEEGSEQRRGIRANSQVVLRRGFGAVLVNRVI